MNSISDTDTVEIFGTTNKYEDAVDVSAKFFFEDGQRRAETGDASTAMYEEITQLELNCAEALPQPMNQQSQPSRSKPFGQSLS